MTFNFSVSDFHFLACGLRYLSIVFHRDIMKNLATHLVEDNRNLHIDIPRFANLFGLLKATRQHNIARIKVTFPLLVGTLALTLWLGLRLFLWYDAGINQLSEVESLKMLGLGLWFDLCTIAYLASPLLLVGGVIGNRLRAGKALKGLRWAFVLLITFSLLFGVVAEYVFWNEFTTRFNFIAVDYLIYTHEVIGNIYESYPVPLILAVIAVIASLITWFLHKHIEFVVEPLSLKKRAILVALSVSLPVFSYAVANVDQMHVDNNMYASELAGNGLFNLAAAMRRNELDYNRFYNTMPQVEADRVLFQQGVKRIPLMGSPGGAQLPIGTIQSHILGPLSRAPKNIVVIMVESLSADYLGAYGSKDNLTPNLDAIAGKGLKFENIYATGTRTVRGLEALSIGMPPIPGQSIIHRPGNDHLTTIGALLKAKGFASMFFYGGYGYFDNMNGYFRSNDYQIIDRTDFDKKTIAAENVWGVADESLFNNILTTLDQKAGANQPFFAHIMTTSNHRPFTFPEGRVDLPQGGRPGAVKYTDYAIGKFLDDAKSKPWFNDTLFVIVADHCSSVAGKTKLPVQKYRIPLIFYAPDMLKPGVEKRMASQIDIAPTLMDLVSAKDDSSFFGESLFAKHKAAPRAFISNYQELGYYKNDKLIVLSPKKKSEAYQIDPVTFEAIKTNMDTQLLMEAVAYYQTASSAFKQGALKLEATSNTNR